MKTVHQNVNVLTDTFKLTKILKIVSNVHTSALLVAHKANVTNVQLVVIETLLVVHVIVYLISIMLIKILYAKSVVINV